MWVFADVYIILIDDGTRWNYDYITCARAGNYFIHLEYSKDGSFSDSTNTPSMNADLPSLIALVKNGTTGGEIEKYTISFNSQGGSAVDDMTCTRGLTISTLPTPTKLGYTFTGWYNDATCVSPAYTMTGDTKTYSLTPTSDITLYAGWQLNTTESITLGDSGGGSVTFSCGLSDGSYNNFDNFSFSEMGFDTDALYNAGYTHVTAKVVFDFCVKNGCQVDLLLYINGPKDAGFKMFDWTKTISGNNNPWQNDYDSSQDSSGFANSTYTGQITADKIYVYGRAENDKSSIDIFHPNNKWMIGQRTYTITFSK
jgi:uncharacterized repeat protein (TIGR02543 family)